MEQLVILLRNTAMSDSILTICHHRRLQFVQIARIASDNKSMIHEMMSIHNVIIDIFRRIILHTIQILTVIIIHTV